jgi:hypothetical protein
MTRKRIPFELQRRMRFEEQLSARGLAAQRLPEEAAGALWRRWRETFASPVKNATGEWVHAGYHWHAFSYGFVHALAGDAAREAYGALWTAPGGRTREHELLLLPCEDETLAWRCVTSQPPQLSGDECNVCPPDFSWSMSFTHEDGWLGPYFTTREWVLHPPPPADGKAVAGKGALRKRRK